MYVAFCGRLLSVTFSGSIHVEAREGDQNIHAHFMAEWCSLCRYAASYSSRQLTGVWVVSLLAVTKTAAGNRAPAFV